MLAQSIGTFVLAGGTLNGTGTLTSNAAYNIQDGTVTAVLAGNVGLNKTTTGTAVLTGANAYSGATSVSAGTLKLMRANTCSGGATVSGGSLFSAAPGSLGSGGVNFSTSGGFLTVGAAAGGASAFGVNGTGWTLNGSSPAISNNVLTITPNTGSQANSVVFNQPVSTHNFTASFTYTDVTGGGADGFALMLENDPRGKTGLGGGGGCLGYSSILNSVALEGNIYSPYTVGLAIGVNGSVAGTYTPTGSVNLSSTAPVNVSLSYTDSTDTLTVQLTQGTDNYQTSYANCGLQANVGPFAYLGITGATGGAQAQQNISNFTYSSSGALSSYTNNVSVAAGTSGNNLVGNVNVAATAATPTVTMGNLSMGAYSTLNVAADASTPANMNYGLTLGAADTFRCDDVQRRQ